MSQSEGESRAVMNKARKVSLSLAAFVLICFFLPWVQLSCMGMKDSVTGFDLAREDKFLWFVPASMTVILVAGLVGTVWKRSPGVLAFAGFVGGVVSAYLMYRERSDLNAGPRLVALQWTALFWLAFLACLGVATAAVLFHRSRSP